jgi:hypothetical protein
MTDTLFCYCCRIHHPKDQMRRFATRHGERWRCLRSIEAAGRSRGERDAFGRQQSYLNRLAASELAERMAVLHLDTRLP